MKFLLLLFMCISYANAIENKINAKVEVTHLMGNPTSVYRDSYRDNGAITVLNRLKANDNWSFITEVALAKKDEGEYHSVFNHLYMQYDNDNLSVRAGRISFTYGMYPEDDVIFSSITLPIRPQSIYRPALDEAGHAARGLQVKYKTNVLTGVLSHGMMVSEDPQSLIGVFYAIPNVAKFDFMRSKITVLNLSTSLSNVSIAYDKVYCNIAVEANPNGMLRETDQQTLMVDILSFTYYSPLDIDFIGALIKTKSGGDTWDKYTALTGPVAGNGFTIGVLKNYYDMQFGFYYDHYESADNISKLAKLTGRDIKQLYSYSYNVYGTYKFNRTTFVNAQLISREGSATESPENSNELTGNSTIIKWVKLF